MSMTIVDDLTQPALWKALAPDGVTPSTEMAIALDPLQQSPGGVTGAARISATTNALNVTLRRTLAAVDLSGFDELRLWINSTRVADGSSTYPFFLELRLASAAMGLADPGNTWQRYLPVARSGTWEMVRLTLADLPPAIRSSVSTLQLRCANAAVSSVLDIDRIAAVHAQMLRDVDAALQSSLDGVLVIGGTSIPAVMRIPGIAQAHARPYIEILQFEAGYSRERSDTAPVRGDYTNLGYALRPPSTAYELLYQITASANDRPTQAQMLEFVLQTVPARGQLLVNAVPLPMEAISVAPIDQIGGFRTDLIPLFYRVSTRQETGASTLVQVPRNVRLVADLPSA